MEPRKFIARVRADKYDSVSSVLPGNQSAPARKLTEFTIVGFHEDGTQIEASVQALSMSFGLLDSGRVKDFSGDDYVEVTIRKLSDDEVAAMKTKQPQPTQ
jgi:hypothetical protein